MANGKTFIKITNRDIFNEIKELKELLNETITENKTDHSNIRASINLNRWMIYGAIAISTTGIGWFVLYLLGI